VLRGVQEKVFSERGGAVREMGQLVIPHLLTREQAAELALPPQSLSLTELFSVIQNLRKREQNPGRYRLMLWQKLSLPVMTAALIMISLPFVCGSVRGAGSAGA